MMNFRVTVIVFPLVSRLVRYGKRTSERREFCDDTLEPEQFLGRLASIKVMCFTRAMNARSVHRQGEDIMAANTVIACTVCNYFETISTYRFDPTCSQHASLAKDEYEGR